LLDHPAFSPEVLAQVRCIGYGASAIPADLLRRVLQQTSAGLSQGYGMTELSGSVAFLDEAAHRGALSGAQHLLASVGQPVPGVEIKLIDPLGETVESGYVGEILVKGPQVMSGYWRAPQVTAVTVIDGWLHTGDMGRFDDQGNLYIVDRKKDMIISGGENIASREVEDILGQHDAVKQVAIVGLPDKRWGEVVCAVVVLAADHIADDAALQQYCRQYLAGYKVPRCFVYRDVLPVNAAGKMDKAVLRNAIVQAPGYTEAGYLK
jgi:acyl-CoA synthetase (AMP-forming)/AMP-acid ligase II